MGGGEGRGGEGWGGEGGHCLASASRFRSCFVVPGFLLADPHEQKLQALNNTQPQETPAHIGVNCNRLGSHSTD